MKPRRARAAVQKKLAAVAAPSKAKAPAPTSSSSFSTAKKSASAKKAPIKLNPPKKVAAKELPSPGARRVAKLRGEDSPLKGMPMIAKSARSPRRAPPPPPPQKSTPAQKDKTTEKSPAKEIVSSPSPTRALRRTKAEEKEPGAEPEKPKGRATKRPRDELDLPTEPKKQAVEMVEQQQVDEALSESAPQRRSGRVSRPSAKRLSSMSEAQFEAELKGNPAQNRELPDEAASPRRGRSRVTKGIEEETSSPSHPLSPGLSDSSSPARKPPYLTPKSRHHQILAADNESQQQHIGNQETSSFSRSPERISPQRAAFSPVRSPARMVTRRGLSPAAQMAPSDEKATHAKTGGVNKHETRLVIQEGNRTRFVAPRRVAATRNVMVYDESTVYQTEDGQFVIPARDDLFDEEHVGAGGVPPAVHAQGEGEEGDDADDDEQPPTLVPEEIDPEEMQESQIEARYMDGEMIRVASPGGTRRQYVRVASRADEDGEVYEEVMLEPGDELVSPEKTRAGGVAGTSGSGGTRTAGDLKTVEFNFLDNKNICCGLCGEIVPYDNLLSDHLPNAHPEVLNDETADMEEIPYSIWLREKLYKEKKDMESGFRTTVSYAVGDPREAARVAGASQSIARITRTLRRVSQVRVNPLEMSLPQLEVALRKKMVEKIGRKVPVNLVDKQHARCGICQAVVSLNRKFEVIHLVRHFNAWHPSAHRCAGVWLRKAAKGVPLHPGGGKPLSMQDFAVVDASPSAPGDALQCIWCGMFMGAQGLAMHFHEIHPEDIDVPKCHLCLMEVVINARLMEKFGEDFEVTLPDEHHLRCEKFQTTHRSEQALDRSIERRLRRMNGEEAPEGDDEEEGDEDDDVENTKTAKEVFKNSRMSFGKRNKPKRNFIMPSLRQAVPLDSKYVEPISDCRWRCKVCGQDIMAAVISAGAIKHFRMTHPDQLEPMQYELCRARLERVSDGCMEFVHPALVECLVCNLTYALHKPYNICRGIRHLKAKHPEMMPEYAAATSAGAGEAEITTNREGMRHVVMHPQQKKETPMSSHSTPGAASSHSKNVMDEHAHVLSVFQEAGLQLGEVIRGPEALEMFRGDYPDNVHFDKVQTIVGVDGEPVYVLMNEGEEIDLETAERLAQSLGQGAQRQQPIGDEDEIGDVMYAEMDEEEAELAAASGYAQEDDVEAYGDAAPAQQQPKQEFMGGAETTGDGETEARRSALSHDHLVYMGEGAEFGDEQHVEEAEVQHEEEVHDQQP